MTVKIDIRFTEAKLRGHIPWRQGDLDFLRSRKAMSKVRKGLSNLAYNFNIKIDMKHDPRIKCDETRGMDIMPNAINVFFGSNLASEKNWLPMSSWILMHRLGHASNIGTPSLIHDTHESETAEYTLFLRLEEIWRSMLLGKDPNDGIVHRKRTAEHGLIPVMIDASNIAGVGFVASHLLTMRSARNRMISTELEIFPEAFAQFLITGRFRLNRWAESGLSEIQDPRTFQSHPSSQLNWGDHVDHDFKRDEPVAISLRVTPNQFDEYVAAMEEEINQKMKLMADNMVGKVFAF